MRVRREIVAPIATVVAAVIAFGAMQHEARAARSLTLKEAVALAFRQDPLVEEARIAVDRSRLAVLRAQLDRVSVKADGSISELWSVGNLGGPTIYTCQIGGFTVQLDPDSCAAKNGQSSVAATQYPSGGQGLTNLQARINVPLFSGFAVEANVALKQRLEDVTTASLRDVRRQTALSVARAYWAVRRLAILRDVQAASIERLRDAEAIADARVKAGLAPPIDRNRATLTRLSRTATVADLGGQVREQTVQLAILLGLDEEVDLIDPPDLPAAAVPPPLAELLDDAAHGRADLLRAGLQLEAQHQAVRIAKSSWYPQLNGTALFQYGNNQFNIGSGVRGTSSSANPFTGLSGSLTFGLTLSMNVKDARDEEARLAQERRLADRHVRADVRGAHARVLHLAGRRVPLIAAAEVARDNLAILDGRYKNGDALVIEFLQAQIDLADAELTLADVTAQLHLAWLELDAALGSTPGVSQ